MDIVFSSASTDLARWTTRDFWPAAARGPDARCRRDAYGQEIGRESPGAPTDGGLHRLAGDALMRYEVFPPSLVAGVLTQSPVAVGTTVGIRYRGLRFVHLFFAARVIEVFDEQRGDLWCTGFCYRTLIGHPELGEETFSVEKHLGSGQVVVSLRSWSRPGTRLARGFAPLVRRLQVHASHAALAHQARVHSWPIRLENS